MTLLILGSPIEPCDPLYRGTYREVPFHFPLPEFSEPNRAFRLFTEFSDECTTISDLNVALSVLKAYRRFAPEHRFELVEATTGGSPPSVGGRYIGSDLSCGYYYSLIVAALLPPIPQSDEGCLPGVHFLSTLIAEHFYAVLNDARLFDVPDDAQSCLDVMMALQRIQPDLYESDEDQFEVVRLYIVDGAE